MAGGRPKGSRNKKTVELIERVAATGKMPLDVMLENMRHYYDAGDRERAQGCATDAAPYLHAKLTSTEVSGGEEPIVHEVVVRYVKADQAGD
jgi:hypothetical protein